MKPHKFHCALLHQSLMLPFVRKIEKMHSKLLAHTLPLASIRAASTSVAPSIRVVEFSFFLDFNQGITNTAYESPEHMT